MCSFPPQDPMGRETRMCGAKPLHHETLNAALYPVSRSPLPVTQYRGIQYGSVTQGAMFQRAFMMDDWRGKPMDCTEYGMICPQNDVDIGYLLRLPEIEVFGKEKQDWLGCLNLDVTVPEGCEPRGESGRLEDELLPVMVWIHGGSQVMTFGSGRSGVCDPTKLVADSVSRGKPMIVVSVNYRLNIFGFGDCKPHGEKNIALSDQRMAIDWVRKHIADFGGDADNITLAGQSAGAVYVHAHIVTDAPVRQAILASGSLGLSPPQPAERGEALVAKLRERLDGRDLSSVDPEELLRAQRDLNVNSLWLQQEPRLEGWEEKTGKVERVMIGDVEYESVLWRNGIEQMTAEMIAEAFDRAGEKAPELRRLYGISATRSTPSKIGALDFINDVRYTMPISRLAKLWKGRDKRVYQYVCDQANPWQASSRAHHAVDLLFLFGGFDLSFDPGAEEVGAEMRRRWIDFVCGEEPWSSEKWFAFGPFGECREVGERGYAARRRARHVRFLEGMEAAEVAAVFGALAAGRISLLN